MLVEVSYALDLVDPSGFVSFRFSVSFLLVPLKRLIYEAFSNSFQARSSGPFHMLRLMDVLVSSLHRDYRLSDYQIYYFSPFLERMHFTSIFKEIGWLHDKILIV